MFKVGIEKLKIIEPKDGIKDPRDNMMLLNGEEIRIEHGQCFRQTRDTIHGKPGDWRRCKADGNFFRETATQRPAEMVMSLWHSSKRTKEIQQQLALIEMEKITTTPANAELLKQAKEPENAEKIREEKRAQKRRAAAANKKRGLKLK